MTGEAVCGQFDRFACLATNKTRVVKRAVSTPSFFDFFSPPSPPDPDVSAEMTDEQVEELEERLELDYQVGEELKEKIIPRAIDWFTGKAAEMDMISDDDILDDDGDEGWDVSLLRTSKIMRN